MATQFKLYKYRFFFLKTIAFWTKQKQQIRDFSIS